MSRLARFQYADRVDAGRLLATGAVAVTMGAYLSVLHRIVTVAGEPPQFMLAVAGSLVAGTLLARFVRPRIAVLVTAALFVAGGYYYLSTLPATVDPYETIGPLVADAISMLSGLSILRIVNAGDWALAITPAPTLFTWYLAVRRHYLAGATVAGLTLGLLVLTGNAAPATTLIGAVGVAAAAGFGDTAGTADTADSAASSADDAPSWAASGAVDDARRDVLLGLGTVVATTSTVDLVPGELGLGFGGLDTGLSAGTTEANLLGSSEQVDIVGSISLSPAVRFTIESDVRGYWRVGSFDRFTGDGWVRTGESRPYDGDTLTRPPGESRQATQTVQLEGKMGNMPALWRPYTVDRSDTGVNVLPDGSLQPVRAFTEAESYTVESRVPVAGPRQLRQAGTDYPERIRDRYTVLPENVPDRVRERTARITANATNPFDTARVVEQWLSNNRDYSLDVEKPSGTIADAFLFEMSAGYCTYFATTMAVMLRTQGIPARFTVGYTPGEQVSEGRWVARGLDAHAWVEVYFPGHGWHRFDPTPGGARQAAERDRLSEARALNETNVDTNETGPGGFTPTPEGGETTPAGTTPGGGPVQQTPSLPNGISENTPVPADGGGTATGGGGVDLPELPPREQLALGAIVALGAVAGARRTGLTDRLYRAVWLRYQPRSDPVSDTRRAYERVEYVLSRQVRPRRRGETVRAYVSQVGDERARRVARLYERATYAGGVTEAEADEAVALADELVGS
ncbi:DUF3488 and DUF4129 domain-containing transglutaminase family protein [Halosegnis sp.]|uniref:transglutaminase TgpA family protein n=1 Tax=Halosegnis sp. TaxID=2864959 RepID=UPI0035D408D4